MTICYDISGADATLRTPSNLSHARTHSNSRASQSLAPKVLEQIAQEQAQKQDAEVSSMSVNVSVFNYHHYPLSRT